MKRLRKIVLCFSSLWLITVVVALGNTDSRHWTLASGEKIHAELVSYDAVKDEAVLRIGEKDKKVYSLEDFSAIDAAWLLEWQKVSADLDELLLTTKGEFSHYQHEGTKHTADFYVYTPSKYKETQKLPLLLLFHPGGKGARYVKRFMKTAEELDLIIVCSDAFRNTVDEDDFASMLCEYFKEFLPAMEKTVPHDPARLYMGGSSGGACRAYHFSVLVDRPWAGVFANGGWLGGRRNSGRPYPKMRIVMVNGHKDRGANHWIKHDRAVLEKRGCEINVFAFEGGHQVPPPKIQKESLDWLLNGYPEDDSADPEDSE